MATPALNASPRESLDSELRGELSALQRAAVSNIHEEQDLDADRTDSEPEAQGSNTFHLPKMNSKRPRQDLADSTSTSARAAVLASVNMSNIGQTKWDTDATESEPELRQSRLRKTQFLGKGKKRWMRGQTQLKETGVSIQLQSLPLRHRSPKSTSPWSTGIRYDSLESSSYPNAHVDSTDSEIYEFDDEDNDDDERTDSEPEPAARRLSIRPEEAIVGVFIRTVSDYGVHTDEDRTDSDPHLVQEGERTDSDTEFLLGICAGVPLFPSDVIQQPAWNHSCPLPMPPASRALQIYKGGEDTDSDVELMALTSRGFSRTALDGSTPVLGGKGPALRTFFVDISAASSEDPSVVAISVPSEQFPEEDETTETDDEPTIARPVMTTR